MADAVGTTTLINTQRRLVMKFQNLSDGTGESAVIKVDVDAFLGPNLANCVAVAIDKVEYNVQGMNVAIKVAGTINSISTPTVLLLQGYGVKDMREAGGINCRGTGSTNDITFTTSGQTSGASYDITLYMRKKD